MMNATENEMFENLKTMFVLCPVASVIFVGCAAGVLLALIAGLVGVL